MTPPSRRDLLPLPTRDPFGDGELIVTRLESQTGVRIEGHFSLGWIARLTPEQLEFAGLLLRHRTNLQKLAAELQIGYNTARSRLDEVVAALDGPPPGPDRTQILNRLARREITPEEASRLLAEMGGAET
ncbi:MAG TPA: DUF2089 domain-containing protein [Candidatus Dormibacteraeota bacterium]|jgi:hypothetical protein|nr:DUF2089 domain-containing protein [Candidatus Dormibacteraeota bacterium]